MATTDYYDNLIKHTDIGVIKTLDKKLNELAKAFSLKQNQDGTKKEISPFDVFTQLNKFYFYRDGAKVLKEKTKEIGTKQTPKELQKIYGDFKLPSYNKTFSDYLKKPIKVNETEYNALFEADPYVMTNVEKVLGSYNQMKDGSTILATCLNLEIDNNYIDLVYEINQEIGSVSNIKLKGLEKGTEKEYKIEQDVLFVDKINYDNTMDLSSIDGKKFYSIPIENIVSISKEIELNKINLKDSLTNINLNDLKNEDVDKIMILSNTKDEQQKQNQINIER